MAERYGKWPGVVCMVGDAQMWCVPCAKLVYGEKPVQAVIDGERGSDQYTDHEGNALGVVLHGSEEVHGMFCGQCSACLCDEECSCYQVDWSKMGALAFMDRLSATTQHFLLDWLVLPWTLGQMLEEEPDRGKAAMIVQELSRAGVLQDVDGESVFVLEALWGEREALR